MSTRRYSARWPGTSATSPTSRSSGWCRRSAIASRCTASSVASTTRSRTRARRAASCRSCATPSCAPTSPTSASARSRCSTRSTSAPDAEDPLLREGFVYEMLLAHEQQHNETMLQLLQMVDDYEPVDPRLGLLSASGPGPETIAIAGGEYEIGAPARGFAYDNERPRHTVELAAFEIDRTPVTNAAYIRVHGGDRRRAADVLGARRRRGMGADEDGRSRPDRPGPSRPPRLLARGRCASPAGPASDCRPSTSGRRPRPRLEGVGQAWEWTSSDFLAYPGFEVFPYPEYSAGLLRRHLQGPARRRLGDAPQRDPAQLPQLGPARSVARSSPASAARVDA